jgi:hypothetical protein
MKANSVRPFNRPRYIDYLVGWRFLFSKDYRANVMARWSKQPWFITSSEIIAGIGSIIFSILFLLLFAFMVLDAWFL